jgi:hypothetical protein
MVGQAAAHLPGLQGARAGRLDVWMKGPVYYGADVALHVAGVNGAVELALLAGTETRPALVARWSTQPGGPLAG